MSLTNIPFREYEFLSIVMPSTNQVEREINHLFFKIFELDPEEEVKSIFTSILTKKLSKDGVDAMILFSYEKLLEFKA